MSTEKAPIRKERTAARIWTEEEKDIVWEKVMQAKENELPLTEAFRQVAKILPHRSEAAVGMLYYNVLRKEREEPAAPAAEAKPKQSSSAKSRELKLDPELIAAFQGLPEYIHQVDQRIKRLEAAAAQPSVSSIIKALGTMVNAYETANDQQSALAKLEQTVAELQEENERLREALSKLQQSYEDALAVYEMFTNMASISQIMSLGDFKQQMKTTLDKWGNVLEITFERVK
ncbi:MAG: hypothetical protein GX195_01455 [Firmicutes bacterium]|jgi:NTP pyrophosphatase (non-canonical NTP hydrolase)|nr:hypothetical protein [Bacillota bacterium]